VESSRGTGPLPDRRLCLSWAVLTAALLFVSACGPSHPVPGSPGAHAVKAQTTLPACAPGDRPERLLVPGKLTGPAAGSVHDGRISRGWSVDGGALKVASAPANEQPLVSEQQAACNLLAVLTPNGDQVVGVAPLGSVLGFGRLTVSSKLERTNGGSSPWGQPVPAPPSYQNRPAWILTVKLVLVSSCPAQTSSTASPAPNRWAHKTFYEVFAIDATTGRDAISFRSADPGNCSPSQADPPSSSVPFELLSLPWRGLTRSGDGASGTIQVSFTACDTLYGPTGAWVMRTQPQVEVSARRILGSQCSGAAWRATDLHPATVGQTIPKQLSHARVGPVDRDLLGR
jgi:hypothetical protein